jgi:hypothetical protein
LTTAPNNTDYHSEFFPILLPFVIWHSLTCHIWKYALDPENSTLNIITNSEHHPPLFFFPYFIAIFHLAQPLSIFGIMHWTLKTAPSTSSPTVTTIPLFFSCFFPLFYCHFLFGTASLSIFGTNPKNSIAMKM